MLFVCVGFHGTSTVKNLTVKPQRIHSITVVLSRLLYTGLYQEQRAARVGGGQRDRLVVVASLPTTFPTLGRVRPNMTEQAALTRVILGQQTLILYHGGLSYDEWAGGWVGKGEAILRFDKKELC